MSSGLKRYQQTGDTHFITFSCFRHRPLLGTAEARSLFLTILEETRTKYSFFVLGYVVMPDHVHLVVTEPQGKSLATAIQVLKQRFSRACTQELVWERRYYDFNLKSKTRKQRN